MRIHRKQHWLLCTGAISGILVGVALPSVRQAVVSSVGPRLMALEMLATATAMMALSAIWDKIQGFMVRWFVRIKCMELVTLVPYYLFFLVFWNPRTYFLCEIVYYVAVSCALVKTANACKVLLFSDTQERIDADNAMDFVWGLSSIAGYGMACLVTPPIRLALALLLVSDFVTIWGETCLKAIQENAIECMMELAQVWAVCKKMNKTKKGVRNGQNGRNTSESTWESFGKQAEQS